jgi:hypothetical protein
MSDILRYHLSYKYDFDDVIRFGVIALEPTADARPRGEESKMWELKD